MQCPFCGFSAPGTEKLCPSCGRPQGVPGRTGAAPASRPKLGKGAVRLCVYAVTFFGLCQGFGRFYSSYLDAEQERAESVLMRQLLEQKRRVREAAREPDEAEGTPASAPQPASAAPAPSGEESGQ